MTGMRVLLHNETDQPLALVSSEMVNGEWTAAPPPRIEPWSVAVMGSDSSGVFAAARGTEGRATYQVGDNAAHTVYLHWDAPFAGSKSFHTNTDDEHYAFWSQAPNGSTVHFTVRPAGETLTDFLPSRDGFIFTNQWDDTPYSLPPLRGSFVDAKFGNADNGLCGGMTYAALDYFLAGMEIPQDMAAPQGEGVPLFNYLVERLFASFDLDTVSLIMKLANPIYPDSDENALSTLGLANGRAAVMAHQEWPITRADIDAGRPSPMVVITVKTLNPGELGKCHQVLAYGYAVHGHQVTLRVYDPNSPLDDTIALSFDDGDVSNRIVVTHNVDVKGLPVYCFARMNYLAAQPTVVTRPRLTGAEIANRGIFVVAGEPNVLGSTEIESGRRTFDVWPDCGEHEFDYHVYEDVQLLIVTAQPHGYRDPKVTWTINGLGIDPGDTGEVLLSVVPDAGWSPKSIALQVSLLDNELRVSNRPADGNFALKIRVRCREGEEPTDRGRSRTVPTSFVGRRLEVDGLDNAMGQCMTNYLNARRAGPPDVSAAAVLAAAQLRRPADPLWDPDPQFAIATTAAALSDPDRLTMKALLDHIAAPEAPQAGPGSGSGIDTHGIDVHGIDTHGIEVHGIDIDLSGFGLPGGPG